MLKTPFNRIRALNFFAFFRLEFLVSTMSWFGFGSKEEPIDEDACRAVRLLFRTNQCCPGLRVVPWNYTPFSLSLSLTYEYRWISLRILYKRSCQRYFCHLYYAPALCIALTNRLRAAVNITLPSLWTRFNFFFLFRQCKRDQMGVSYARRWMVPYWSNVLQPRPTIIGVVKYYKNQL